jgi:hypothetical protein
VVTNAVLMKSPPEYSSQADFLITVRKYASATITLFLLVSMKGYIGAAGALQKAPIKEANLTKVCQSQGGRFLPYALQGKEPRRIRGSETLSLCRAYKSKTCCGKEQTDAGKFHISSRLCTLSSNATCSGVDFAMEDSTSLLVERHFICNCQLSC